MEDKLKNLIETGLMTLGFLVAKEGSSAEIVVMFAQSLKNAGAESSYLDDLLA